MQVRNKLHAKRLQLFKLPHGACQPRTPGRPIGLGSSAQAAAPDLVASLEDRAYELLAGIILSRQWAASRSHSGQVRGAYDHLDHETLNEPAPHTLARHLQPHLQTWHSLC